MVCVLPQAVEDAARGLKRMRLPSQTALHEAGAASVAVLAQQGSGEGGPAHHGEGGSGGGEQARAEDSGAPRSPDESGERLLRAPRLADDSDDGSGACANAVLLVAAKRRARRARG
jgi:hypothetical protein